MTSRSSSRREVIFLPMIKRILRILVAKPTILVGGQAVIEGVMMRVPGAYATAVRTPEGTISVDRHPFTSRAETSRIWKWPVFRGIIGLFEAMKIGFSTLQWSADIALPEEEQSDKDNRWSNALSTLFAVVLAVSLFMIIPYVLTTYVFHLEKSALSFNLMAGLLRITFFVVYLLIISLLKDVKRLFMNHGAEHKVVYNFESGREITVENAQSFQTQHPRCGTSFMFIVLMVAILVFAIVDTIAMAMVGQLSVPVRLLMHLPLIPLVAGLAYEGIKLSSRRGDKLLFRILRAPGLWLQNITTSEPEDGMVEVAIVALKSAFGDRFKEFEGRKYQAEAV